MQGRAHQRLLVASPLMEDRNFRRSVVAVLDHTTDGAFGLVLTRPVASLDPAEIDRGGDAGRRIAGWLDGASEPRRVYEGGPVQPSALMALATVRDADRPWASRVGSDGAPIMGAGGAGPGGAGGTGGAGRAACELVSVDLSADPSLAVECDRLRIFRGYAGWGPGQLDGELEIDGWIVAEAIASRDFDDVFCASPATLWRDVLGRQPGATSWLRDYPADPSLN